MGKTTKAKASPRAAASEISEEVNWSKCIIMPPVCFGTLCVISSAHLGASLFLQVSSQVVALKNEGNKLFAKRDYTKALEQYEQAVKLLPEGATETVELLCNKAACFYQMKRSGSLRTTYGPAPGLHA